MHLYDWYKNVTLICVRQRSVVQFEHGNFWNNLQWFLAEIEYNFDCYQVFPVESLTVLVLTDLPSFTPIYK